MRALAGLKFTNRFLTLFEIRIFLKVSVLENIFLPHFVLSFTYFFLKILGKIAIFQPLPPTRASQGLFEEERHAVGC